MCSVQEERLRRDPVRVLYLDERYKLQKPRVVSISYR